MKEKIFTVCGAGIAVWRDSGVETPHLPEGIVKRIRQAAFSVEATGRTEDGDIDPQEVSIRRGDLIEVSESLYEAFSRTGLAPERVHCYPCGSRIIAGEPCTATKWKGATVYVCSDCLEPNEDTPEIDAGEAVEAIWRSIAKDRAESFASGELEDSPCIDWQGFDQPSTY